MQQKPWSGESDVSVDLGLAFAVVGAWCLAAFTLTYVIVRRRR